MDNDPFSPILNTPKRNHGLVRKFHVIGTNMDRGFLEWDWDDWGSKKINGFIKKIHGNISYPIGSMYGIYANIWGILMVNVTIYTIHGSYGYSDIINTKRIQWEKSCP